MDPQAVASTPQRMPNALLFPGLHPERPIRAGPTPAKVAFETDPESSMRSARMSYRAAPETLRHIGAVAAAVNAAWRGANGPAA